MSVPIPGFTLVTDYTELPGAKCSLQQGKLQGERQFRVLDYSRYPAFIAALAGGIFTTGSTTTYQVPNLFRADMLLWCTSATMEGIGIPTRLDNGEETFLGGAKVTANYETLSYDPRKRTDGGSQTPSIYATESKSTGGSTILLAKKDDTGSPAWYYTGTGAGGFPFLYLDDNAPDLVKRIAEGGYTLTRH